MRGCVSAGMIAAVSTLGLMDTFDAVYGSSAGSLVGAYAIAGQVSKVGGRCCMERRTDRQAWIRDRGGWACYNIATQTLRPCV